MDSRPEIERLKAEASAKDALIAEQAATIAELKARVEMLEELVRSISRA